MSLILSPSLVLLAPDGYNRSLPVIGWHNMVTLAGTAADHEVAASPAINVANPSTNLTWRSGSLATQYLTFSLSEDQACDYIGIARHNLGSGGIIISVEMRNGDGSDWIELVEGFVVADDAPVIVRFPEVLAAGVRLKLVPIAVAPEIAVLHIGRLLVMPLGIPVGHTPLIDGRVTRTASEVSEAGDFLGSIILSQKLASSVSFQNLGDEWYRQNMRPFVKQGRGTPFFWSGFPESHPREAGYAWLTSDPLPDFIEAMRVNITLDMGGIIT